MNLLLCCNVHNGFSGTNKRIAHNRDKINSSINKTIGAKGKTMKKKIVQIRNALFYSLVAIFIILATLVIWNRPWGLTVPFYSVVTLAIAFVALSVVLIVLTAILKEARIQKIFFILTAASAIGIPICIILHNLVYALFIHWFGSDFWLRRYGVNDEPYFFITAVIILPALFILGALGSIVLIILARLRKNTTIKKK